MKIQDLAIPTGIAAVIVIVMFIFIAPAGIPGPGKPAIPVTTSLPPLTKEALPLSERLNSTDLLLREPVGGFHGDLIWLVGPDNLTQEYVFYSRDYGPGNVILTVYEVSSPLNTTPVTPSPGISARMVPDRFAVTPGTTVTAQLGVNITPAGYSHDPVTRTFYVHAEVEGEKNAVADDWIRVQMADRPTTWTDYQTTGDFSERDIRIRRGGSWQGTVTVIEGERGTGPVHVWFREIDCTTMAMGSDDVPQAWSPGKPVITVSPDRFTGRSFGRYAIPVTITAGPDVPPDAYCYGVYYDTADGHTSYSVNVHVMP